VPTDVNIAIN